MSDDDPQVVHVDTVHVNATPQQPRIIDEDWYKIYYAPAAEFLRQSVGDNDEREKQTLYDFNRILSRPTFKQYRIESGIVIPFPYWIGTKEEAEDLVNKMTSADRPITEFRIILTTHLEEEEYNKNINRGS